MGAAKTNIEALLMKHVLLNGSEKGPFIELNVESYPKLAEQIGVDYSALTRRLKQSELFKVKETSISVKK